jgi:hypothetical protein
MPSRRITITVEGQPRRYTTAATAETVDSVVYSPGLTLGAVTVHGVGQVAASIDDPAMDWASLLLAYSVPPAWPCSLSWGTATVSVGLLDAIASVATVSDERTVIGLQLDTETVPGARMVPDPGASLIVAGDSPSDGHAEPFYIQDQESIGQHYPLVYGAPGLGAMEADASIGGPTTVGVLLEVGMGALYLSPTRIAIASPPRASSTVTLYDVSAGQDDTTGEWLSYDQTTAIITDGRGRSVQVVDLEQTPGMSPQPGQQYGIGWSTTDAATDRDAHSIVVDLLRSGGYPVDSARMRLGGLTLDFAIYEPVDPVSWIAQHLGGMALWVGRSTHGFYARIVPVDQQVADMALTLGPTASYGPISIPALSEVASSVQVSYAPINGELSRVAMLTPTGSESGATRSPACARAFAAGHRLTAEVEAPTVCDPTTALRIASIIAADRCTPGGGVVVTVSDPTQIAALLRLGPAVALDITDETVAGAGLLTGRRLVVESMTVTDLALAMVCTIRPEA